MYISPHPILNLLFWVFLEHGGPLIKPVFWKLMSRQREILGKFGSKSGIFQHCQSFKNSFSRFFLSTLKFSYQPSKLINPEFQEITKKSLSTLNPFWLINPQLRVGKKLRVSVVAVYVWLHLQCLQQDICSRRLWSCIEGCADIWRFCVLVG